MSYVVKGYKFPQSCRECWLVYPEGLHNCSCILTEKYWEFEEEMPSKSRLPECPLVEIPTPHGRLIDADTNVGSYVETWTCNCSKFGTQRVMAVDDLKYLPTIIEAEVSE